MGSFYTDGAVRFKGRLGIAMGLVGWWPQPGQAGWREAEFYRDGLFDTLFPIIKRTALDSRVQDRLVSLQGQRYEYKGMLVNREHCRPECV
jgi:hypothetical protein